MSSALLDLGRILTFRDDSYDRFKTKGYRWDSLIGIVALVSGFGTLAAGPRSALADSIGELNPRLAALRYVGSAMQASAFFWVGLMVMAAVGSECLHRVFKRLGVVVSRHDLCVAFALAACPLAARSVAFAFAGVFGSEGFPVLPWTLLDPVPIWSGYLLYRGLSGSAPPPIPRILGGVIALAGYVGLLMVGSLALIAT